MATRRFRLTDARGCRREAAALYAALRNEEISDGHAKAAAAVLRLVLDSIRVDEIEARLAALEQRQE